jgi:ABC-type transport system involved in multi-copper enzyme maturation permease subunit
MPKHILQMIRVEMQAVFGRSSGRAALVLAALVPIVVAIGLAWFQNKTVDARFNGMAVSELADLSMRGCGGYALMLRNMVVLPLLLVLATAASVAGERRDNTLREVLVRPIPRWSVVLSKAAALWTLSGASLVITAVFSIGLGAGLFDTTESISDLGQGYLACLLTDLGLIGLAMLAASLVRSVGGVVVILILLMMVDIAGRGVLTLAGNFGMEDAAAIAAFFPGAALDAWEGWKDGFQLDPFIGLGVLILGSLGLTCVRFQRMDVP